MLLPNAENYKTEQSQQYWEDELANTRMILHKVEEAIIALQTVTIGSGGITEYTLDTGQNRQTVKRADLPMLLQQQKQLLGLIDVLEARLRRVHTGPTRIVPGF